MRITGWLLSLLLLTSTIDASIGMGEAFCGADISSLTDKAPTLERGIALIVQATENLQRWITDRQLEAVHGEDAFLALAFSALQRDTNAVVQLRTFVEHLGTLHMLADTANAANIDAATTRVTEAVQTLLSALPAEAVTEGLRIARLRSCHTHTEQTGERGEQCFRCGARLSRPVPAARPFAGAQRMVASLVTPMRLTNGVTQTHRLRLSLLNHAPLAPGRLLRMHGEKIHVFLLDPTFTDYHHVHPRASIRPGEYEFQFTPGKPGDYRLWVELHVAPFGFRQYARLDLKGSDFAELRDEMPEARSFRLGDINFDLVLPRGGLNAGITSEMKLHIRHSSGERFQGLEPLMEAFAHLVGFEGNYLTVLHTHPLMPAVTNASARGGPELAFQILPTQEGELRLFAQVKIAGEIRMIPFCVHVGAPASQLTARALGRIRD